MKTNNDFAELIIVLIKELSASGKKLNKANLIAAFTGHEKEISSVLNLNSNSDESLSYDYSLLAYLESGLILLINYLSGQCSPEMNSLLKSLKMDVIEKTNLENIGFDLKTLENRINKEYDQTSAPAMFTGTPVNLSADSLDDLSCLTMDELKLIYLGILGGLDQNLEDEEYTSKIAGIRNKVFQCQDVSQLINLHKEIETAAAIFAQAAIAERNKATTFMSEIYSQLSLLEGQLVTSMNSVKGCYTLSDKISDNIENQMEQMRSSAMKAKELDSLKNEVATKINKIQTVLQQKRSAEKKAITEANKEMKNLKTSLSETMSKIKEIEEEKEKLAETVRIDPLTKAYNRLALQERLDSDFELLRRHNREFSVLMIDIDNFKVLNDTYGHPVGDRCLVETVSEIKTLLRKSDMLVRYGGEEFIVVLAETNLEKSMIVAEKIRKHIKATNFMFRNERVQITVSIGVAQADSNYQTTSDIIEKADRAMYKAKKRGRDQVSAI